MKTSGKLGDKMENVRANLLLACLWGGLVAVALLTRPLLPVDETRYLAVAWEMWQRGDFLVPYLNGDPYSHKPPLLFWGIHAGWALFGVNDWSPRLIAPLFGLASLMLTGMLGRMLWPDMARTGGVAQAILIGALFWTLFTTMTMFDMLHVCFTLSGLIGLVVASRGRGLHGFAVFGLSIGLGVLGKGPAILLHVLPVALAAPLWAKPFGWTGGWGRWYGGVGAAVLVGAGIGLAWALPAAAAGGEVYSNAILWGQSAGRMVDSFAHGRPFWWFAAILPVMILPWLIWPPIWRAVRAEWRHMKAEGGTRLCFIWFVVAFLGFSAISGKQPHYLLPEFPALALLASRALVGAQGPSGAFWRPIDRSLPAMFFLLVAVLIAGALHFDLKPSWATSVGDAQLWPLAVMAGAALVFARVPQDGMVVRTVLVGALSVMMIGVIHLTLRPLMTESHDFRPFSQALKKFEDQGVDFVTFGKYHGQFHFLGRLRRPIEVVDGPMELDAWLANHPKAMIIALHDGLPAGAAPEARTRFRSRLIGVWRSNLYPPRVDRLNRP